MNENMKKLQYFFSTIALLLDSVRIKFNDSEFIKGFVLHLHGIRLIEMNRKLDSEALLLVNLQI